MSVHFVYDSRRSVCLSSSGARRPIPARPRRNSVSFDMSLLHADERRGHLANVHGDPLGAKSGAHRSCLRLLAARAVDSLTCLLSRGRSAPKGQWLLGASVASTAPRVRLHLEALKRVRWPRRVRVVARAVRADTFFTTHRHRSVSSVGVRRRARARVGQARCRVRPRPRVQHSRAT